MRERALALIASHPEGINVGDAARELKAPNVDQTIFALYYAKQVGRVGTRGKYLYTPRAGKRAAAATTSSSTRTSTTSTRKQERARHADVDDVLRAADRVRAARTELAAAEQELLNLTGGRLT